MRVRLALFLAAICIGGWLYASGTYASIDAAAMLAWLQEAGAWGGVLFISAYCVLQPLGVRSLFFLLTAPVIWDPATAFALSWAGTVAASIAAFGFARFVARGWVQRHLPPGIRRLDDRLALGSTWHSDSPDLGPNPDGCLPFDSKVARQAFVRECQQMSL